MPIHPADNFKSAQTSGRANHVAKSLADVVNVFNSSFMPGIGVSLRKIRLEIASKLLYQVQFRCNFDELVQVKRQLLLVQCEAINLFKQTVKNKKDMDALFVQVSEALEIWKWRRDRPHVDFLNAISTFRATLSFLPDIAQLYSHPQSVLLSLQSLLSKSGLASDLLLMPMRIEISHSLLEETFHQAIRHFEAGRWAPAMSLLKSQDAAIDVLIELEDVFETAAENSSSPLESRPAGKATLTRKEYDMQLAICRASQLIHTGDWHFKEAETGIAEDMMGRAQLAQDDYRAALLCVTGQDVELEGTALARLARFYAKIAMLPVPAHQLYLRAVHLAASLAPALPKGQWYKDSVAAVQAHRDELEAQETKEWAARRQPILLNLASELDKLRGGETMTNREFCEFVFKEWPPRTDGPLEPPQDYSDPGHISSKHFLKVIQRYHTDRNSNCGEEWLVMCEEISKELTARYNIIKGAD